MNIAVTEKKVMMEFQRIGGSYQMSIRNVNDLRLLLELNPAHWALNSISCDSVRIDRQFLDFIDDDANGQIRADEVKRAVSWFLSMLHDFSGFENSSDTLPLSSIDTSSPDGARLLSATHQILSNLGKDDETQITLQEIRNDKQIVACAQQNGDGVIPAVSVEDPVIAELIDTATKFYGSVKDACGSDGIDGATLDKFLDAASAYLSWAMTPESDPKLILPFGKNTTAFYAKYNAVAQDIDDYFITAQALSFNAGSPERIRQAESEVNLMNIGEVRDFFSKAPVTEPRADEKLDFSAKLNPEMRDALLAFAGDPETKPFLGKKILSFESWEKLKQLFAPYKAYLAAKPLDTDRFDALELDQIRKLIDSATVEQLRQMIADDLAAASRLSACDELHKLILFQRYLLDFLNNFVNLSRLFHPEMPSLLQIGTLVMDGRNFTLCTPVTDLAEHKRIAQMSDICVIYLEASCGKPDALKTMKLAVAVTSGNVRNLFIGKRGVFSSADGDMWDAKVIDFLQQPVSISEALRMPFYKFGEFLGKQTDRFFSAKSQEAQKTIEKDFNAAATAATAAPAPVQQKVQTPAVSGSMMLMGGGIGIAALGSSIAFIVKSLANVSILNVLAILFGIILIFGGPVVAVSLIKLYRRNVSRFFEANGCAVNRRMRLSRRMGAIFTFIPGVPNSNYNRTDLVNLFRKPAKKSRLPLYIILFVIIALAAGAGYWCYTRYLRTPENTESVTRTESFKPPAPKAAEENTVPAEQQK